jgi:hypothetical protein
LEAFLSRHFGIGVSQLALPLLEYPVFLACWPRNKEANGGLSYPASSWLGLLSVYISQPTRFDSNSDYPRKNFR